MLILLPVQLKKIAHLSLQHLHSAIQSVSLSAARTSSHQVTVLYNALGLLEAVHLQQPVRIILTQTALLCARLVNLAKSLQMPLRFVQVFQTKIVLVLDAF